MEGERLLPAPVPLSIPRERDCDLKWRGFFRDPRRLKSGVIGKGENWLTPLLRRNGEGVGVDMRSLFALLLRPNGEGDGVGGKREGCERRADKH